MDLRSRVLSGLRWLTAARVFGQLITWAAAILVIRILHPADFGLFALAMVPIGLLELVEEAGLGAALVQRREVEPALLQRVFGALLLFNATLYAIVYATAPLLSGFFEEPRLTVLIRVLGIRIVFLVFSVVPESMLRRNLNFRPRSVVEFIQMFVQGFATLGLALAGLGVWSLVVGFVAASATRAVGMNVSVRAIVLPRFGFGEMFGSLRFGGLVTARRVLWYAYSKIDVLIIGKLLGKEPLGAYSVAMTLATMPMTKTADIFSEVAFAAFSRIQDDAQQVAKQFLRVQRILGFLAFPVCFGIASVAPELVRVLFGERWLAAAVPLRILALTVAIRILGVLLPPALLGIGRPDINLSNAILAFVLMTGAFAVGSHWGLVGVTLAWAIAYPLLYIVMLSRASSALGIGVLQCLEEVRGAAIGSTAMFLTVSLVRHVIERAGIAPTPRLAILVGVGVAFYCAYVVVFQRSVVQEVRTLATG